MSLEGRITIDFVSRSPVRVRITPRQKLDTSRLFAGKTTGEVVQTLPLLFSLCAQAHACAANQALFGSAQDENAYILSELAVLCESAREHALRIFTGWAEYTGRTLDGIPVHFIMGLTGRLKSATGAHTLFTDASPNPDEGKIRNIIVELDGFLAEHVFSMPCQDWLELDGCRSLGQWAEYRQTIAATYVHMIECRGWSGIGSHDISALPPLPAATVRARLLAGTGFSDRPIWDDLPRETGAFVRTSGHKIIRDVIREHGPGLLARVLARLVELAQLPARMHALLDEGTKAGLMQTSCPGLGCVETARGRLYHAVRLHDGLVESYEILAPTEWNFHPRGPVRHMLEALNDNTDLALQADMLISAIDPCVRHEVRMI